MNEQLVALTGSLADVAKSKQVAVAEVFSEVKVLLLFDHSYSMQEEDATDGQSRFKVATKELARLQQQMPGKVALLAFADTATFCPSGMPPDPKGTTIYSAALDQALRFDGLDVRLILISDGEPNDPSEALKLASYFKSRIDAIYIGPEGGEGLKFLQRFVGLTGGRCSQVELKDLQMLSTSVLRLLAS